MLWWVWCSIAGAADVEAQRIVEELHAYTRSGEWRGVERHYLRLLDKHPVGLDGTVHLAASKAARQRGDLMSAAQRLLRVRETDTGYPSARAELEQLEATTGLVMWSTEPPGPLKPDQVPFAPDMRLAVEKASEQLADDGKFVGVLPVGTYTLGDLTMTVRPGWLQAR